MADETVITVVGNLTDDPELRFIPSGAAVAHFTVASTPRVYDREAGDWKDAETLFLRCSAWRQEAEHVAQSLSRGTRVIVQGRLRQRAYETKEGERRTVVECEVDEIGPSLRFATARVTSARATEAPRARVLAHAGAKPADDLFTRNDEGGPSASRKDEEPF
ncbi:single-stranded DNA-binding protein [Streptosporangium lutulentum]|uniref:Single-stranded DNA-binding protein n=1 Tax=Streptosporangium lutulentum TaxID=1461250 RepID=A0ABT9Q463_9ACTN|nr:single-stranded DNA-binding protein [Streptosporangium lutulentum]MDP9841525.1 single-strand DNA-binding protein [Streptosporangium lutulentum]